MLLIKSRVFIIFIIILIIVLIGIIIYSILSNPLNIFQRKFNFKLPNNVEIMNKSYSFYYDSLKLQACFDIDDFEEIEKGIKDYAAKNLLSEFKDDDIINFNSFKIFCSWWDEKKEEVILAYHGLEQGRWGVKTREICVLMTHYEEQYFLHVYY